MIPSGLLQILNSLCLCDLVVSEYFHPTSSRDRRVSVDIQDSMKSRYQYRIYPTDEQQRALAMLFGCVRVV